MTVIRQVAAVRGGEGRPSYTDPPDGWMVDRPRRKPIPVEVVRDYPWPAGTVACPDQGAPAARAEAQVERMVSALQAAGTSGVIFGVHDAREPYAVPAASKFPLPLPVAPINRLSTVQEAIRRKCARPYAAGTILVVDLRDGFPMDRSDLEAVGLFVAYQGAAFAEVWIVPELHPVAQQVPLPSWHRATPSRRAK